MTLALLAALLCTAAAGEGVREDRPPPPPAAPQLTKLPALLEFHPAIYPPDALAAGLQADVACALDLDAEGAVTQVQVTQGASPEFDANAVAAIKSFRFSPAEFDGKPAPVRIQYIYHYVITRQPKPPDAPPPPDPDAGAIDGEIREAGTRNALAGADISVEESSAPTDGDSPASAGSSAQARPTQEKLTPGPVPRIERQLSSDGKGRFHIEQLSPGIHRLNVSLGGFAEGTLRVRLEPKQHKSVTIYLRRSEPGELTATVKGERPTDAPTVRSLSRAELENLPGALNDPIRAVQNLPGLARAPFLSGALLVRGSASADTGIYIDGDKVPIIYHFLGGPSIIPETMLERLDFYPGGYGAYYGRNLTGALDVTSRGADGTGLHGDFSPSLLQSSIYLESPINDSTKISAGLRRSMIDLWLPAVLKAASDSTSTFSVVPIYYDYQVRLDHKFANGDTLELFGFGSDDRLGIVETGTKLAQPVTLNDHIGLNRLHATWKHNLGSELQLVVSPSLGQAGTSFDTSGTGEGPFGAAESGDLQDISAALRAELRWQLEPWLQLRAGTDSQFDRTVLTAHISTALNLVSIGPPQVETVDVRAVEPFQQWGEYVEGNLKLGSWQLTPGLRFDQLHARENTKASVDPRLWARYALDDTSGLKLYGGLYHQGPGPQQLLPTFGNPQLHLASAGQVGIGYDKRFSDLWNASVELFYNRQWDLVEPVPAVTLSNGQVQNLIYSNVGVGRAYGLELLVRREFTATLYGFLSYTLSRSQLIARPGDPWRAFTFDQPHILTLVAGWRPTVGWELSTRFRYTSGNPTAPVDAASFNADSGGYDPERGTLGDARSPAFLQLDARAQYTFIEDHYRLSVFLDVENLTNHKNEEFHVWDYRYRQSGSLTGLPILPTMGLELKW